ncbi:MAG: flavin monoamine oxidase family protein [Gammaproteobacteria bacterium]
MLDIVIIGGGLSGLYLAYRLQAARRAFAVYEARDRFGGRILSLPVAEPATGAADFAFDLGPSWIWPDSQPRIAGFIERFGIAVFPQWIEGKSLYHTRRTSVPETYYDRQTYAQARRIRGGSYRLIETLLGQLPNDALHTGHKLVEVADLQDHVRLKFIGPDSNEQTVSARQVVVTLPPRLAAGSIAFVPELDHRLSDIMSATGTWMAGQAKAVIRYPHAFWRRTGYSGSALAVYPGAALGEIFDAGSDVGEQAALSGFFAWPAPLRERYRQDSEALILDQLVRLFGKEAAEPNAIVVKDWFQEAETAVAADEIPPVEHPVYGHRWLRLDHWRDKLYFGGTETAPEFGGYLEGALEAAERVAGSLALPD